jgi:hypothetical protein
VFEKRLALWQTAFWHPLTQHLAEAIPIALRRDLDVIRSEPPADAPWQLFTDELMSYLVANYARFDVALGGVEDPAADDAEDDIRCRFRIRSVGSKKSGASQHSAAQNHKSFAALRTVWNCFYCVKQVGSSLAQYLAQVPGTTQPPQNPEIKLHKIQLPQLTATMTNKQKGDSEPEPCGKKGVSQRLGLRPLTAKTKAPMKCTPLAVHLSVFVSGWLFVVVIVLFVVCSVGLLGFIISRGASAPEPRLIYQPSYSFHMRRFWENANAIKICSGFLVTVRGGEIIR